MDCRVKPGNDELSKTRSTASPRAGGQKGAMMDKSPKTRMELEPLLAAVPIYFPTIFRSASLILSCQPDPVS
jgi:hypothetical protein